MATQCIFRIDDDVVVSIFRKILFWSRCTGGAHPSIRCAHVVAKTLPVRNSSWPNKLYSVHSIYEQLYSALGVSSSKSCAGRPMLTRSEKVHKFHTTWASLLRAAEFLVKGAERRQPSCVFQRSVLWLDAAIYKRSNLSHTFSHSCRHIVKMGVSRQADWDDC